MENLVLFLVDLVMVCSARGASAGDTAENSVTFEVDLTTETRCLHDDYYFDVYPGDSIAFTWTEREPAPDVVTTDANNDPYPLFGGTGTYTVPGLYTIPPDVPESVYPIISCSYIGKCRCLRVCSIRGNVNVRKRT